MDPKSLFQNLKASFSGLSGLNKPRTPGLFVPPAQPSLFASIKPQSSPFTPAPNMSTAGGPVFAPPPTAPAPFHGPAAPQMSRIPAPVPPAPKITAGGQTINPATGGVTKPVVPTTQPVPAFGSTNANGQPNLFDPNTGQPLVNPNPPPAPTVPKVPQAPSAEDARVTAAETAFAAAGAGTPEQEAAQAQLDELLSSTRLGVSGLEGQGRGIPLELIRGQQAQLEKQGLLLAEPLNAKLARMQAKRLSGLEISKFALERADTAKSAIVAAKAGATASAESARRFGVEQEGAQETRTLAEKKFKEDTRQFGIDYAQKERGLAAKREVGTGNTNTDAKNWVLQFNSGLMSIEDIYTKIGSSKEASVLKNEVARLVAGQGGKRVYGADDASIQAINSQIKNVDDLLKGNVGSIVGFVQGGLGVLPDSMNIYKQDALAIAKNLTSNQTLQALADAKSKGITFGALSERELGVVAESASRIAAKLIIDKAGNITGFSGSQGQFIKDLKVVKEGLKASISTRTGGGGDAELVAAGYSPEQIQAIKNAK